MKSLLPLLLALICSCASVPMASPQADARAKTFASQPGKCGVYIFRNEMYGMTEEFRVELDGRELGTTGNKTFLLAWVAPGVHELVSVAERNSRIAIDAKAGALVFVWQEVKADTHSKFAELHQVEESKGQAGVRECKLAETKP